jgi:uncharacterized protein (TIGR00730 family)
VAAELGATLARQGWGLVYGGQQVGLMGAVARAVHAHGGRVTGVIPEALFDDAMTYREADELIVTPNMRERKATMEARADAFLGLPGGFGTLEEIMEILTLKQIQVHTRPLVLLNTAGFYGPLIELFEHFYRERFAKAECRELCHFAADVPAAFAYLDSYQPPAGARWF